MSIAKAHIQWLSLVDISGPFLSVAALERVFPQGLDGLESGRASQLRAAYDEWKAEASADLRFHQAWVHYVLGTQLEWDASCLAEGQAIADSFKFAAAEHGGETVRPQLMLHERNRPDQPRVLVCVYPPGTPLEKPLARAAWAASPAARTFALLRATGVRLGLVTNGEQWLLVNAPADGLAGYVSWYAELWGDEPDTLRAFVSLLCPRRFFGVADEDTLEALLDESANDTQEVTDQLGLQVRHAVEILVHSLDRANQDSHGALLAGISEARLYEAALTVMMRLVFLLSAEERGLFLLGDPLYDQSYAVSTLREQLHETADRLGEEVLERRSDAWARLLATFRLVYEGAAHEDLLLPAYGGSLFDPARFPFLEGRAPGMDGAPPHVDNRTVLHLLDALQILRSKGEPRRLSFRALDIEQIGHVYEGLLDHEARRASEVMLGFTGREEPEIALSALQPLADAQLHKRLSEATGRGAAAIKNALNKPYDADRARRLQAVCAGDEALYRAVLPFLNLLRDDEFGYAVVILPGSVFVTAGTERRATGTHYTPRSLTEPIVQHTLEPVVYRGPAEGWPKEQWQLKTAPELLTLKVCDMAMGSGAFLVQACRYLSERLVEAWERALTPGEAAVPTLTIDGSPASGALGEMLIPAEAEERLVLARRLVADRCLYGVDKNPLAVEMAKLSLWLTTLAKGRAFTFLDHALKCGDSLVGASVEQLRHWSLDTSGTQAAFAYTIRSAIEEVIYARRELESFTVLTVEDQQRKAGLLARAAALSNDLRDAADHLVASHFNDLPAAEQKAMRADLLNSFTQRRDISAGWHAYLPIESLRPFHWELEFPEVFYPYPAEGNTMGARAGFDAIVGNPPFQGGQHLTGAHGVPYRDYLVNTVANGRKGSADLCAYFFLRAYASLRRGGAFGLIATNTIAQGDSRDVGLVQLDEAGATIFRATNDLQWPGAAAVVVDVVHVSKGNYRNGRCLDDQPVEFITPLLDDIAVHGHYLPNKLDANASLSFHASVVLGMGFVLTPDEAQALIDKDPRNRDVLFPYLNGEDLNDQPDQAPTRWVINFFDWPEERAMTYRECYAIVREKVYPERMRQNREIRKRYWWRFGETAPRLYRTIAPLRRVLVIALTSRTLAFAFAPNTWVFSHATGVLALDGSGRFALLQSTLHNAWSIQYASSLKTDVRYTPSDVFEPFPIPSEFAVVSLDTIGEAYHETRRQIMLSRWEGLTTTYNRFHNPKETSADIASLRDLHRQMDEAVALAYGWSDMDLGHGFHETAQGTRYTITEPARREVLKRLLALNHERYTEEVAQGLHEKKKGKGGKGGRKKSAAAPSAPLPLASSAPASGGFDIRPYARPSGSPGSADGDEAGDGHEDEGETNAPPPEQATFLYEAGPKQGRLL